VRVRSASRVSPWRGSFASLALAPRTAPRARIDISISLLSTLAPLLARLRAVDPKLEDQSRRAAMSVALNIAEANQRVGKDRRNRFRIGLGSAAARYRRRARLSGRTRRLGDSRAHRPSARHDVSAIALAPLPLPMPMPIRASANSNGWPLATS
jgi:23S rRNA-intervening sequence protein